VPAGPAEQRANRTWKTIGDEITRFGPVEISPECRRHCNDDQKPTPFAPDIVIRYPVRCVYIGYGGRYILSRNVSASRATECGWGSRPRYAQHVIQRNRPLIQHQRVFRPPVVGLIHPREQGWTSKPDLWHSEALLRPLYPKRAKGDPLLSSRTLHKSAFPDFDGPNDRLTLGKFIPAIVVMTGR
jgi:hypothetical protein